MAPMSSYHVVLHLAVMSYLPCVHLITTPDIRGWTNTPYINDYRLEVDQKDIWVVLTTNNLQQCLRLCWLFSSCRTVSYSPGQHASCQLFDDSTHHSRVMVVDTDATVVNMTDSVMKKGRLFGCDTRPCAQSEMCITTRQHDEYKCLPLASALCGAPPVIANATFSTDGLGFTSYKCKEGFVSSPEEGGSSICDKADHSWPAVTLSCRYTDCGPPDQLEEATVRYDKTDYGSVARYSCRRGHFSASMNNMTIECLRSGQWSEPPSPCELVDCGQPAAVENGLVHLPPFTTPTTTPSIASNRDPRTFYGEVAIHTCVTGYENPLVSAQTTCESNGQWSNPSSFYCSPVDCGNPKVIDNTTQVYNSSTYLSIVTYVCVDGLSHPPDMEMTSECGHNGSWSSIDPNCSHVDCGDPHQYDMTVNFTSTTYGSVAYLNCSNPDHVLIGSNTLRCNQSGNWSHSNASCVAPPCSSPISAANAVTVTTKMTSDNGYVAIYTCLPGLQYSKGENSKVVPCEDGIWRYPGDLFRCRSVDCGSPPLIPNSDILATSHTFNSKAQYTCQTGYKNKTLTSIRTCLENGSWSQEDVGCEGITCGSPPLVEHSDPLWDIEHLYGDEVTYQCVSGFSTKTSNNTIQCTETGWDKTPIECVATSCGTPPPVPNSTYVIEGDGVIYTCDDRLRMKTETVSKTCQQGAWSDDEVLCVPNLCPDPPEVGNATAVFNSTEPSSTVTYTCNDGFRLLNVTKGQRTCQDSLKWSTEEVSCDVIRCASPPTINNTTPTYSDTTLGSEVIYRCSPGFLVESLTSNITDEIIDLGELGTNIVWKAICNNSGQWSSDVTLLQACTPINCGKPPHISNASISVRDSSSTLGEEVTYYCNEGYELKSQEFNRLVCGSAGSWEGQVECVANLCPDPPTIPNARIVEQNRHVNNQIVFQCDEGHRPGLVDETLIRITCQTDLTWSNTSSQCVPVDCHLPPNVTHATATYNNMTTLNHQANYTCNEGFKASSSETSIRCLSSGNWSGVDFECVEDPKDCPPPEKINKAKMTIEGNSTGDSVMYSCVNGYTSWWFERRTCLSNGTWTNNRILCKVVDCGPPPLVPNATVVFNSTTYHSVADYTCVPPYKPISSTTSRCNQIGNWVSRIIQCKLDHEKHCPLELIKFGKMKTTSLYDGSIANHYCLAGYHFESESMREFANNNDGFYTRICENGKWSGKRPNCVEFYCGPPPDVENGQGNNSQTTQYKYNSKVFYTCNSGYTLVGASSRTCTSEGRWSDDVIECISRSSVYCSPPTVGKAFLVEYNSHIVGSIATYICDDGYVGNSTEIKCLETGQWSDMSNYTCQPVDCHQPPEFKHATTHVHLTTFGHHVIYTCDLFDDIDSHRPSKGECLATGEWSNVTNPCLQCNTLSEISNTMFEEGKPACNPVDCGRTIDTPNTLVSVNTTVYTSEVTYSCKPRFLARGSVFKSVCLNNGSWSDVDISCVQCSMDQTFKNGYLVDINETDLSFSFNNQSSVELSNETNSQQARVMCDDNFWLQDVSEDVNPVVTCVMEEDGNPRWDFQENLKCYRHTWPDPKMKETIHLFPNYDYYKICVAVQSRSKFKLHLKAINETAQPQRSANVLMVTLKYLSELRIEQTDFDGTEFPSTEIRLNRSLKPSYEKQFTENICIEIYSNNTFKVLMDNVFMGATDYVNIPIWMIQEISFQGNLQLFNITIEV